MSAYNNNIYTLIGYIEKRVDKEYSIFYIHVNYG